MKKRKVTNGVYYIEIPKEDLRILCGCPADVVKHLKKNGFLPEKKKNGVMYETGPNAILLSDASIQNGSFANLSEFPVLQMFYKQGMIIPGHPNNLGKKPMLIGLEDQVRAQSQYIYRGNYGLTSVKEIVNTGIQKEQAKEYMRLKLRFAFDKIKQTEDLIEFHVIDKDAVELSKNVIIHRKGFNIYEFLYEGESIIVDLNLFPEEEYISSFDLNSSKINREYFSVVHIGEGNGWDVNRPCMASIITFQGKIYLIDAGPGITFSLKALGLSVNEVEGIFHTHAHDDHFAGLTTLVRSDHLIKYFATPLVRASVTKKLSALMSIDETDFDHFFEIHDLEFDKWNNIDGLEVKPIFSPHPVETSVFFFRTFGQGGYETYAHFADIPSFSTLDEMVTTDIKKSGITQKYCDEIKEFLLTKVDLKKIDIGGGMIHGAAEDFANDQSEKIFLSHIERDLTDEEKKVGLITEFGKQNILIPAHRDYILQFAFEYLSRYFPGIPEYELRMLLNCPVINYKKDTTIIKKGDKNREIYLILSGLIEFIDEESGIKNTLSSNSLIGELSGLLKERSKRTYYTISEVQSLQIPCDLYCEFIKRNNLQDNLIQKHEKRHFLQSTWLFGEMVSFPIQNKIAELMAKKTISIGDVLFQNDKSYLYLLEKGEINIQSEKRVIEIIKPGRFFGEENILHKTTQLFKARASEESEVYVIPGDILLKIPIIHWKLLETFERRLKIFGTQFAFEWREAFSVNIEEIDVQHKSLFKIINSLYLLLEDKMVAETILEKVNAIHEHMKEHFTYEEQLMDEYDYDYFSQQRKEHEIMIEEVEKFRFKYNNDDKDGAREFLDTLKEHLIVHTLIEDKKYRSFFNERGVY